MSLLLVLLAWSLLAVVGAALLAAVLATSGGPRSGGGDREPLPDVVPLRAASAPPAARGGEGMTSVGGGARRSLEHEHAWR